MSVTDVAVQLLQGLQEQLPAEGFRLVGIEIELGALVELDGEHLRAAVMAMLPRVEVRVTRIEAVLRCKDCGAEYPSDEHPCPACGSPHAELVHGAELGIVRAWGETLAS